MASKNALSKRRSRHKNVSYFGEVNGWKDGKQSCGESLRQHQRREAEGVFPEHRFRTSGAAVLARGSRYVDVLAKLEVPDGARGRLYRTTCSGNQVNLDDPSRKTVFQEDRLPGGGSGRFTMMSGGFWDMIHPGVFLMETGMMKGIKERAEQTAQSA